MDRGHIHSHIVFNSVNADTGENIIAMPEAINCQIRAISDRLCREHGLSVILSGETSKSMSYVEWLRQSKGQPTFRSMLEAESPGGPLRTPMTWGTSSCSWSTRATRSATETVWDSVLRGQERFQYPGRKNATFTENGIRAAILGNLEESRQVNGPHFSDRPMFRPYRRHPKYTGFWPCTFIISTCWEKSNSDSIPPG